MTRSLGIAAALTVLAVATASTPLGARELQGLQTVVSGMSEPAALLVWGTVLAGLSRMVNRRQS